MSKGRPRIHNKIEIIHEDRGLLVLDKPTGMVVNRSQTTKEKTLQDYLDDYLGLESYDVTDKSSSGSNYKKVPIEEIFHRRSGLVHRLDKGTSGVILTAKTPEVLKELMQQFKSRSIEKEYFALVHGKLKDPRVEIRAPIARNPRSRTKFAVVEGGKEAVTIVEMEKFKEKYSLVKVSPKTGRTHQIRVHLAALNHPVVGDLNYASKGTRKEDRKKFGRMMLHAYQIQFIHPMSSKKMTSVADLPSEFKEYY